MGCYVVGASGSLFGLLCRLVHLGHCLGCYVGWCIWVTVWVAWSAAGRATAGMALCQEAMARAAQTDHH